MCTPAPLRCPDRQRREQLVGAVGSGLVPARVPLTRAAEPGRSPPQVLAVPGPDRRGVHANRNACGDGRPARPRVDSTSSELRLATGRPRPVVHTLSRCGCGRATAASQSRSSRIGQGGGPSGSSEYPVPARGQLVEGPSMPASAPCAPGSLNYHDHERAETSRHRRRSRLPGWESLPRFCFVGPTKLLPGLGVPWQGCACRQGPSSTAMQPVPCSWTPKR